MTRLITRVHRSWADDYVPSIATAALLVIDMQYLDAHRDFGVGQRAREQNMLDAFQYYFDRLDLITPNIRRLLDACRDRGVEVVYTRIASLTPDGRDRSLVHKRPDLHTPEGAKEAQILGPLAPQQGEIVISKTCSGPFNGTNIDYVLRNLGVDTLLVCGVIVDGCVETTVRDASDRGYHVVMVEDGCAGWSEENHRSCLARMDRNFAVVMSTQDLVEKISRR